MFVVNFHCDGWSCLLVSQYMSFIVLIVVNSGMIYLHVVRDYGEKRLNSFFKKLSASRTNGK